MGLKGLLVVLLVFLVINLSLNVRLEVSVFDPNPLVSVELGSFKSKFDLFFGEFTVLTQSVEANYELDVFSLELSWHDFLPDLLIGNEFFTILSRVSLLLLLLLPSFLLFLLLGELLLDNVVVLDTSVVGVD